MLPIRFQTQLTYSKYVCIRFHRTENIFNCENIKFLLSRSKRREFLNYISYVTSSEVKRSLIRPF